MTIVLSPVTITVVPWPFFGQYTLSPTRAIPFPCVSVTPEASMTHRGVRVQRTSVTALGATLRSSEGSITLATPPAPVEALA